MRSIPALAATGLLLCCCASVDGAAPAGDGLAPGKVVATPWPYTALVAFAPPAPNGKVITSYTVSAVNAQWIHGTGPVSPIMVYGGGTQWSGLSYRFQVTAHYADGTASPPSAPSNAVTPSGGTSDLVYGNGMFYWEGDYSYQGTAVYADTTGNPVGGRYDVMYTSTAQGAWQPWSPGGNFDLAKYRYLQFDLKPTVEGETWSVYFENVGDIFTGKTAVVPADKYGTYGSDPVVGQWTTSKIPLRNMNVGPGTANVGIYKFGIKDDKVGTHVWYVNNVRFTAD
jgi:hypothetical protein